MLILKRWSFHCGSWIQRLFFAIFCFGIALNNPLGVPSEGLNSFLKYIFIFLGLTQYFF
uniref:Uncharacterized protein n=1 Tax=Arundo donax TaxID=35708 RepID=A0A0A9GMB7_ARUDO